MIPLLKASNFNTWFDTIPPKWEVRRIKTLFLLLNGSTPSNSVPEYWDGDIIWVTPADLGRLEGNTIRSSQRRITKAGYQSCGTTLAPRGSLVLTTRAPVGNVAILGNDACTNQGCKTLVPRHSLNSKYFYYQLLIARPLIEALAQGSTFVELSNTSLSAVPLLTPPLEVQNAIASFLDHKTAQIDALIAEKRKLIELLREKRNALISHAVTKGLNPNVPMKDSGVEWIGEIPAHWEVLRLKYALIGGLTNGLFKKRDEFGAGVKLVNVSDVYQDDFFINFDTLERVVASVSEQKKYGVEPGDIFLVRSSLKREGVAATACILDTPEPTVFECHVVLIRPNPTVVMSRYLINLLNTPTLRQRFIALAETVTMTTISQPKVASLPILVPPNDEQVEIINHINEETARIRALIDEVELAVEKLNEYRIALISAAVTGKIDVLNWQKAGTDDVDELSRLEQEVVQDYSS